MNTEVLDPMTQPPTFHCTPSADGKSWIFDCPHCRRRHRHAARPGHRLAHCHATAPWFMVGYFVQLAPSHDNAASDADAC